MTDQMFQPDSRPLSANGELTYTPEGAGGIRGHVMRAVERMSGLQHLRPRYEIWRNEIAGKHPRMFNVGIDMLETSLVINARQWPPQAIDDKPVVIIANHPFGIGDGIAVLALAEDLGRPYRVLLNTDFMRVPEVRPFALPIDFSDTPEAVETNLRTRNEARALMKQGVTMVIFPAGGVATARWPWGMAEELPWKTFAARLIQMGRASVLPVFFEGQNSPMFHAASRIGGSLRMSLLVAEFRRFPGAKVPIHVGEIMPFASLRGGADRNALIEELYVAVQRLAPHNAGLPDDALKPLSAQRRANWPWDKPLAKKRGNAA